MLKQVSVPTANSDVKDRSETENNGCCEYPYTQQCHRRTKRGGWGEEGGVRREGGGEVKERWKEW